MAIHCYLIGESRTMSVEKESIEAGFESLQQLMKVPHTEKVLFIQSYHSLSDRALTLMQVIMMTEA